MILKDGLEKLNIAYDDKKIEQIEKFYEMLIEKNKVMNLTRITDKEDFYVKHVLDSLLLSELIDISKKSIIDIGTGAGFPGIPIKIFFPDTKITLLDSLNKRILFIDEVINNLKLNDIDTVHGRAEEFGRNVKYREKYDIAVSRAVADLSVLSELCIPLVKVNGIFAAYKSIDINDEVIRAKKAIDILSGSEARIHEVSLPCSDIRRNIIVIKKNKNTPKNYPRNSGIPSRKPL